MSTLPNTPENGTNKQLFPITSKDIAQKQLLHIHGTLMEKQSELIIIVLEMDKQSKV
jgi:hypothetical protein